MMKPLVYRHKHYESGAVTHSAAMAASQSSLSVGKEAKSKDSRAEQSALESLAKSMIRGSDEAICEF